MGSLTSSISDKIDSGEIKTNSFGEVINGDIPKMYDKEDGKLVEKADINSKFEDKFGDLGVNFDNIQTEQYELFQKKMLSYGKSNITLGTSLETEAERDFALLGVTIRLHDKLSRLKNLQLNKKDNYIEDESIEDTIIDIANYGVIALMVKRNQWK